MVGSAGGMAGMNMNLAGMNALGMQGAAGAGAGGAGAGASSWSSWAPQQGGQKDNRGPAGANLFVYGLPDAYADSDLNALFSNFGTVISATVQKDKATGTSKGFGFVSFTDAKDAAKAIAGMDGLVIGTKRLNVRVKKGDGKSRRGEGVARGACCDAM